MTVSATLLVRFALEIDRVRKLLLELPSSYKLKGDFRKNCTQFILDTAMSRTKPLSDDHVKQLAVKWCKEHRLEMDNFWHEWNRPLTSDEYQENEKKRFDSIKFGWDV